MIPDSSLTDTFTDGNIEGLPSGLSYSFVKDYQHPSKQTKISVFVITGTATGAIGDKFSPVMLLKFSSGQSISVPAAKMTITSITYSGNSVFVPFTTLNCNVSRTTSNFFVFEVPTNETIKDTDETTDTLNCSAKTVTAKSETALKIESNKCSEETRISFGPCDSIHPAVAMDGCSNTGIVWHDTREGNTNVYAKFLSSVNTAKDKVVSTEDFKLSNCTTNSAMYPDIVRDDDGRWHIVYQDNSTGNYELYYIQGYNSSIGPSKCTVKPSTTVTNNSKTFYAYGNRTLPDPVTSTDGNLLSKTGIHKLFRDVLNDGTESWRGVSSVADQDLWNEQASAVIAQMVLDNPDVTPPVWTPDFTATSNYVADTGDFGTAKLDPYMSFMAFSHESQKLLLSTVKLPLKPKCVPQKPLSTSTYSPNIETAVDFPIPPTFNDYVSLASVINNTSTDTREETPKTLINANGHLYALNEDSAGTTTDFKFTVRLQIWEGPSYIESENAAYNSLADFCVKLIDKEFSFEPGEDITTFNFADNQVNLNPGKMIFFVPIPTGDTEFWIEGVGKGNSIWTTKGKGTFSQYYIPFTVPPNEGINAPIYYDGYLYPAKLTEDCTSWGDILGLYSTTLDIVEEVVYASAFEIIQGNNNFIKTIYISGLTGSSVVNNETKFTLSLYGNNGLSLSSYKEIPLESRTAGSSLPDLSNKIVDVDAVVISNTVVSETGQKKIVLKADLNVVLPPGTYWVVTPASATSLYEFDAYKGVYAGVKDSEEIVPIVDAVNVTDNLPCYISPFTGSLVNQTNSKLYDGSFIMKMVFGTEEEFNLARNNTAANSNITIVSPKETDDVVTDSEATTDIFYGTKTCHDIDSLTFSKPIRLTRSSADSLNPRLAIRHNKIWMVFHSNRTGSFEVYACPCYCGQWMSSNQGGLDLKLTNAGQNKAKAMFANADIDQFDEVHIVYHSTDTEDGAEEIFYIKSTNGAKRFLKPKRLTASTGRALMPSIAISKNIREDSEIEGVIRERNGIAICTWHDSRTGQYEIYAAIKDGDTWASSGEGIGDTRITQATGDSLYPRVVCNVDDDFKVVWHDYRKGEKNPNIYLATYSTSVGLWSCSGQGREDVLVTKTGTAESLHPDIAIDLSGGEFVVWHDSRFQQEENIRNEIMGSYCAGPIEDGTTVNCSPPIITTDIPNVEAFISTTVTILDEATRQQLTTTNNPNVILSITSPGAKWYRIANENGTYSDWQQFVTGATLDTMIMPWTLSNGAGKKTVYVQVQDAKTLGLPVKKEITLTAIQTTFKISFFTDSNLTSLLPSWGIYPVAALGDIYIKVEASVPLVGQPSFDVVTRGIRMIYGSQLINLEETNGDNLISPAVVSSTNRIFKGKFRTTRDDGFWHVDGPARIIIHGEDIYGNKF